MWRLTVVLDSDLHMTEPTAEALDDFKQTVTDIAAKYGPQGALWPTEAVWPTDAELRPAAKFIDSHPPDEAGGSRLRLAVC